MMPTSNLPSSMTHLFEVRGMECASCINKVYRALTSINGVHSAKVSLDPPQAEVVLDNHVAIETMNEALRAVGEYSLKSLTPNGNQESPLTPLPLTKESFFELYLLLGFLLGGVALREVNRGYFDSHAAIKNFIGGSLTIFAFFKVLDLKGFVEAYRSYDPIAQKCRGYAFAFPFIELLLGVLYLVGLSPMATSLMTIVLMTVNGISPLRNIVGKRDITDSVPGTLLNLPLPKVILAESIGVAGMALLALIQSL